MKQTKAMRVLAALKMKGPSVIKTSMWKGETCSNDDRCHHGVRTAVACLHRPEADDGAFLADVALGLVLGGLSGSHAVQDGQPHHRLRLQAHPVQEHGSLQLGFIVGLDTETDKKTLMVCKKWRIFQMDIYSDIYHGSIFIFMLKDKSESFLLFLQTNLI